MALVLVQLSIKTTLTLSLLIIFAITTTLFIASCNALSTVSISETSPNHTLICALVHLPNTNTNNLQYPFLNCSSYNPTGTRIPVRTNLSLSGLVGGDGFVCAVRTPYSSSSIIVCWRFSIDNGESNYSLSYKRIYSGAAVSELESGTSRICGLVNDRVYSWPWGEFQVATSFGSSNFSSIAVGGDLVCGLRPNGEIACDGSNDNVVGQTPVGNYSAISAGQFHACAISRESEVVCWGSSAGAETPRGKFKSLAAGENRTCALDDRDRVVCWGQGNFSLPEKFKDAYFISIEAKRSVFCGVLKSNFSLHCWGNEVFDSNSAVFDLVQPGPCRRDCPCGPIAYTGSFCQQGYSICEHCPVSVNKNNNTTPVPVPPPQPALPPPQGSGSGSNRWSGKIIAFVVVGCVGSLALLAVSGFFLLNRYKCGVSRVHDSGPLDEDEAPGDFPPGAGRMPPARVLEKRRLSQLASIGNVGVLEEFPLQMLLEGTKNFSEDHRIGTGSFGRVYFGTLQDGRQVAIKRAEMSSGTSSNRVGQTKRREQDKDNAFVNELESLSRLHHKNLVRLYGFCEYSNERILVYEHMSNGNLHDHLHKLESSPLMSSWAARIKVALDAARGIEYLHEYAIPPMIHRDIKSSNILLDENWSAKVSDFGLSLIGPDDEESHLSLRVAGTVGYMDPEYYRLQQLTTKSDVYSFGVVLLEILSGYKAIHKNENGVPRNVVDFVVPYIVQDDIHRVLDTRVPPPTPFEIEAVAYVGYLAVDCVTVEGRHRPSMSKVVNSLERALAACLVHPNSISRSTTGSSV